MVPLWRLEEGDPSSKQIVASCASTQGVASRIQGRIVCLFPLLRYFCTENNLDLPSLGAPMQVSLIWFSCYRVTVMGLGTGISSWGRVTQVHAGQSKVPVGPDFLQASHCIVANTHSCLGCASGTVLCWEIKAMHPCQLEGHFSRIKMSKAHEYRQLSGRQKSIGLWLEILGSVSSQL